AVEFELRFERAERLPEQRVEAAVPHEERRVPDVEEAARLSRYPPRSERDLLARAPVVDVARRRYVAAHARNLARFALVPERGRRSVVVAVEERAGEARVREEFLAEGGRGRIVRVLVRHVGRRRRHLRRRQAREHSSVARLGLAAAAGRERKRER